MSKSTATLALNGEVRLADLSVAVQAFNDLMSELTKAVAGKAKAEWIIESLEVSSAIATVRGIGEPDSVELVIDAYEHVGEAAQFHSEIPYGEKVRKPISRLASILNGRIPSIRFETESFDAEMFSPDKAKQEIELMQPVSYGAAQGRIQSLSNRGTLRFTLYDSIDDHAISCYLTSGSEDAMRNAWGRLAVVEGIVRRNPVTGLISTIRDVSGESVSLLDEGGEDDWRDAIGCAPALPNSISPEEAIRRIRNG